MQRHIKVSDVTLKDARKELKKEGWVSAHYLTRHGVNVDKIRKLAKNNLVSSTQLHNGGSTTWYYKHSEIDTLADEHKR